MTLYHATSTAAAAAILRDGFRDARGSYGFATLTLEGVFFADRPVDENEGATCSESVIVIALDEAAIAEYEIIEEQGGREWCIPAALANASPVRRILTADELDAIDDDRWDS